ncbi:MAG: LysR family transcriptional regulator [Bacteroidales bacterium]|nr:LysR family transcriptional regulator [Bacteroidales bacterium]MBQ9701755.1 LysR family transcriptional regulator [Bacteroidales bacterium]MBR1783046.1 LysR family transcriptional regulator [Bacteroidales bacterium]
MLEDSKIRAFLEVEKERNFTRAAAQIGISQPAVSAQIAALEESLGTELFERGRELRLTPSGEIFLGYARRIQQAYDLANNAFNSVFAK